MSTDAGAKKVVDYIYRISDKRFWQRFQQHVDREELLRRFLMSDRSERALFELLMTLHADGKPIGGEKTPAHVYVVPTLMTWFPNAKIIHTVRDPRAIYVSIKRKRAEQSQAVWYYNMLRRTAVSEEMFMSLNVLVTWLRIARLAERYKQQYAGRYFVSKYEDLINTPHAQLQKICDFLDIKLTAPMLQPTVYNSSVVSPAGQVQGFDPSAVDRWRTHIHPAVHKWFTLWTKKHLQEFGYQP
jgi:hypothetical protein